MHSSNSTTDLHQACRLGELGAIQAALETDHSKINEREPGVRTRQLGWTPLYRTVICGNLPGSKFLLESQANPNLCNNLGDTPLHQAADNSQYELAELLMDFHANPNAAQNDGETPLHHAAFKGDVKMVRLLLKYGADPNQPSLLV